MKYLVASLVFCVIVLSLWIVNLKSQIAGLQKLPSIQDIQRRIGAKPDGIVGEETLEKWDAAICQQFADIYINNKTMGVEK